MTTLDNFPLDLLFLQARTHNGWDGRPVDAATLQRLYDLARMPPTSMNCQPMRLVFVQSPDAKQRLLPSLSPGNVDKTMAAPVTAIVAYDTAFLDQLPALFPSFAGAQAMVAGMPDGARANMALLNGSLQGGYLILAARALGLDCGPMAGFNNAKVDEAFLAGTTWKSSFLLNLGYGDPTKLYPRGARLGFDEACQIV